MKEEKYTCDICHEEHDVSELTYFDESYLCEDCLRRETFICRDCGDRHWNDDSADGDLCQTCYDEDYVRCERNYLTLQMLKKSICTLNMTAHLMMALSV